MLIKVKGQLVSSKQPQLTFINGGVLSKAEPSVSTSTSISGFIFGDPGGEAYTDVLLKLSSLHVLTLFTFAMVKTWHMGMVIPQSLIPHAG